MPVTFEDRDVVSIIEPDSTGGTYFISEERAPRALVALEVRSGSRIDAVTPIYRELRSDGGMGEEISGPRFGGQGGTLRLLEKSGYVIVGIGFRLAKGRKPTIRTVELNVIWQRWTASGPDGNDQDRSPNLGTANGGAGSDGAPREVVALNGSVAIGIHGFSGSEIDRLSLITARPVVTT